MFDTLRLAHDYWQRIRLPIGNRDLVLDVGSGDDPHPRADVLLDLHLEGDIGRPYGAVVDERPFVIGEASHMPFRDNVFDYVICSHLLEHVPDPSAIIKELTRVGKRGYVETPSELQEKIGGSPYHRWMVREEGGKLVFTLKDKPHFDPLLRANFNLLWRERGSGWKSVIYKYPHLFTTALHWEGRIPHEVFGTSEGELPPWLSPDENARENPPRKQSLIKRLIKRLVRTLVGSHRRVNLEDILACPMCKYHPLALGPETITCGGCNRKFPVKNGMPVLLGELALRNAAP